jgi:hypothetical protein
MLTITAVEVCSDCSSSTRNHSVISGERVVFFVCCSSCWIREKSEPVNGLCNTLCVSPPLSSFVGPQSRVSRSWTRVSIGVAPSSCSCCCTLAKKWLMACKMRGPVNAGSIRAAKGYHLPRSSDLLHNRRRSSRLDRFRSLRSRLACCLYAEDPCVTGSIACTRSQKSYKLLSRIVCISLGRVGAGT